MVVHDYDAQALVPTATKTANYTASVNDWVIVNGNAAAPVITLPAAPAGAAPTVGIKRFDTLSGVPTFTAANIPTIAVSGSDAFLGGSTTPLQLLLQGQVSILQYDPSRAQWIVRSTDEPISGLDSRYLNQTTTGTAAGITGKTTPTGALVGTTDTQTLTNKTLTAPAISSPTGLAKGDVGLGNVDNTSDATKNAATAALTNKDLTAGTNTFPTLNQNTTGTAAGITGKTTPTGALVGTTDTQTLTNKTLTTPAISSPTGLVKGDVGLGNVDNTSDATKNSATAALTNKDLTGAGNTFPTFNQNTTGSAAKLTTAHNINGQPFDGTADVTLDQYAVLPSAYTLTSQTAAQKLLNTTTNGALTLQTGVYFFECAFGLTSLSSTSGSFGFGFGGTATFTQAWVDAAAKGASLSVATANAGWNNANNTAGLIAFSTSTNGAALIRGVITVTVAGTVIPQVSMTTAAAAVVSAGSYFRIQSVGSTAAFAGSWS